MTAYTFLLWRVNYPFMFRSDRILPARDFKLGGKCEFDTVFYDARVRVTLGGGRWLDSHEITMRVDQNLKLEREAVLSNALVRNRER